MGVPAYVFFIIVFPADGRVIPHSAPAANPAECTAMAKTMTAEVQASKVETSGIATSCTKVRRNRPA